MNNLNWYLGIYYKFRDYPIAELNSAFKPNELKAIYPNLFKKLLRCFQIDASNDLPLQGIISQNHHDMLVNQKAESPLLEDSLPRRQSKGGDIFDFPELDSQAVPMQDEFINNSDVFYELMIKMIRVSLRKLTIETLAHFKLTKILQNHSDEQFGAGEGKGSRETEEECFKEKPNHVEITQYAPNVEQLKFQFLKYCISTTGCSPIIMSTSNRDSSVSLSEDSLIYLENAQEESQKKTRISLNEQNARNISQPDIEKLILNVSEMQTTVFNRLMSKYLEATLLTGREAKIMSNIGKSLLQIGQSFSTDKLQSRFVTDSLREEEMLSRSNILLSTWLDLIFFNECPQVLFQIVEELVKRDGSYDYITNSPQEPKFNQLFYDKMSAYLHLLILDTTKNIFLRSLCKVNYLVVILFQVVPPGSTLKLIDIVTRDYEEPQIDATTNVYKNLLITTRRENKQPIWMSQSIGVLSKKWKIIAHVLTELCVSHHDVFFASVFQSCAKLMEKQLSAQIELVQQIFELVEGSNIVQQQRKIYSNESDSFVKGALCRIVREVIGCNYFGEQQQECEIGMNINTLLNENEREKRCDAPTFFSREEDTEELQKWNLIIEQNIYICEQYSDCIRLIRKTFQFNYHYVGLWFIQFHEEMKTIIKKLPSAELDFIFQKFKKEVLTLWESMTVDNYRPPQARRQRNPLKRISGIKTIMPLSINQKKALILNYMLKAELELYSRYRLSNALSTHQQSSKVQHVKQLYSMKLPPAPFLFEVRRIAALLLFPLKDSTDEDGVRLRQSKWSNFSENSSRYEKEQESRTAYSPRRRDYEEGLSLGKLVSDFELEINIELDLRDRWGELYAQPQIDFLTELNYHIRLINEINFTCEYWNWIDHAATQEDSRQRTQQHNKIQLLSTEECYVDVLAFQRKLEKEAINRREDSEEEEYDSDKQNQDLGEIMHTICGHNKELFMMMETIAEGENYDRNRTANLLRKDETSGFKGVIGEFMSRYSRPPSSYERETVKRSSYARGIIASLSSSRNRNSRINVVSQSAQAEQTKTVPLSNNFEYAPYYYKTLSKIFRLNCLMASFVIPNQVYRNIKNIRQLSAERQKKLLIIGGKYFAKIAALEVIDGKAHTETNITSATLVELSLIYERKLLTLMITLINMIYEQNRQRDTIITSHRAREGPRVKVQSSCRTEEGKFTDKDEKTYEEALKKYGNVLKLYLLCRIKQNSETVVESEDTGTVGEGRRQRDNRNFDFHQMMIEMFDLNQTIEACSEEQMITKLESLFQNQDNGKILSAVLKELDLFQEQLATFPTEEAKVEYMRKRLSYALLREIYFHLCYDNDFLSKKEGNSIKNYAIYEKRVIEFFEEVIRISYEEYTVQKEVEKKKRSLHLRNYEYKYEEQPVINPLERHINKLICCIFNQLLCTFTQDRNLFLKSHRQTKDADAADLFQCYMSAEFVREAAQSASSPNQLNNKPSFQRISLSDLQGPKSEMNNERSEVRNSSVTESKSKESIPHVPELEGVHVRVYAAEEFINSQSYRVFEVIKKWQGGLNLGFEEESGPVECSLFEEGLTGEEIDTLRNNQTSLATMLKAEVLERIHQTKCELVRNNLISRIEKLYITIDVRHKVFESFKDKILDYEMQKAKIYHQYMDYIRGLKLDVYAHMADESSVPYIKVMKKIKLFRLEIKQQELERKVLKQFQKNLKKWNNGIQSNLQTYQRWLAQQNEYWESLSLGTVRQKHELSSTYHVLVKEVERQKKKIRGGAQNIRRIMEGRSRPIDQSVTLQSSSQLQSSFSVGLVPKEMGNVQSGNRSVSSSKVLARSLHSRKRQPGATPGSRLPEKKSVSKYDFRGLSVKYQTKVNEAVSKFGRIPPHISSFQPQQTDVMKDVTEDVTEDVTKGAHRDGIRKRLMLRAQSSQRLGRMDEWRH